MCEGDGILLRALVVFSLFCGAGLAAWRSMPEAKPTPRATAARFAEVPELRVEESAAAPVAPRFATFAEFLRNASPDLIERDLAEAEDQNEILQFGPVRIRRGLVGSVLRAARRVDIDPVLLMAIADKESSFAASVQARTSSAMGLFQFIETTWLRVVRQFGAKHGLAREAALIEGPDDKPYVTDARERARILDMRAYPYLSALLAAEMLKADGGKIALKVGRGLSVGETYLTHFLGPSGADLFMQKLNEAPSAAAAHTFKAPARANKPIFYAGRGKPLSIANVHEKFEDMMGLRVKRYSNVRGALAYTE